MLYVKDLIHLFGMIVAFIFIIQFRMRIRWEIKNVAYGAG